MSTTAAQPSAGFAAFPLKEKIQRGIAAMGFEKPRPIQAETIPAALEGRDVLGLAPTGTGKTAGFGLPILQRLLEKHRPGPRALIIAPTRELAMQINVEIKQLAKYTRVKTATLFGGVSSQSQIRALRTGPDILVACPGRLLDLYEQGYVMLHTIEVLVLDEADHMFDMGFLPDLSRILKILPGARQNLLFSATMPKEIRRLADDLLSDPHSVELISRSPAETIEHAICMVSQERKPAVLDQLIDSPDFRSAIVFCRTKYRARRLGEQMSRQGHRAIALQGNMTQGQRDRAMSGFRAGTFDILVATDIASRGIDVAGVSHVINFDVPSTPDAYTHRIGRTGRAEMTGKAFTLVTPADRSLVRAIEKQLGTKIRVHAPKGGGAAERLAEPKRAERAKRAEDAQRADGPKRAARPKRASGSKRASAPKDRRRRESSREESSSNGRGGVRRGEARERSEERPARRKTSSARSEASSSDAPKRSKSYSRGRTSKAEQAGGSSSSGRPARKRRPSRRRDD